LARLITLQEEASIARVLEVVELCTLKAWIRSCILRHRDGWYWRWHIWSRGRRTHLTGRQYLYTNVHTRTLRGEYCRIIVIQNHGPHTHLHLGVPEESCDTAWKIGVVIRQYSISSILTQASGRIKLIATWTSDLNSVLYEGNGLCVDADCWSRHWVCICRTITATLSMRFIVMLEMPDTCLIKVTPHLLRSTLPDVHVAILITLDVLLGIWFIRMIE
jgi:hypothetical protein